MAAKNQEQQSCPDKLNLAVSSWPIPAKLTPGRWFFPSPKGKGYDPDNFSRDLRKTNRKAGLQWTCLDFRHTFGSHLAMKGESPYKISALMGNSPEICRRHYAALIPATMVDSMEFVQIDDRTRQVSG